MAKKRKSSRPILPLLFIAGGLLLIIGGAWLAFGGGPAASPTSAPPANGSTGNRIPFPDMPRVSVADAKAAFDTQSAVFVDARGEPWYSSGHIPGALSITEQDLPANLDRLREADWIITYCT